jgi:hypothetical protein
MSDVLECGRLIEEDSGRHSFGCQRKATGYPSPGPTNMSAIVCPAIRERLTHSFEYLTLSKILLLVFSTVLIFHVLVYCLHGLEPVLPKFNIGKTWILVQGTSPQIRELAFVGHGFAGVGIRINDV